MRGSATTESGLAIPELENLDSIQFDGVVLHWWLLEARYCTALLGPAAVFLSCINYSVFAFCGPQI